ncbi:SCO family protein [Cupriavidus necator]|uniref:SCO family protein n=1 Tax=Cupriavidus necator TaxID=106590 RepID=UPI001E46FA90|nr:SCO family protein [Cupriavidus necator]
MNQAVSKPGLSGTIVALLAVIVLGIAAYWATTAGFSAVTSDGLRRIEIARAPRDLPPVQLVDQDGSTFSLSALDRGGRQLTLVLWVYIECQTVCRSTLAEFSYLQQQLKARGLDDQVRLLTLSFDPRRDTQAVLAAAARRMQANAPDWRFATVTDPADIKAALREFGIVVLPDGLGGYSHNTALFLVDASGHLVRAYDVARPDLVLAEIASALKG